MKSFLAICLSAVALAASAYEYDFSVYQIPSDIENPTEEAFIKTSRDAFSCGRSKFDSRTSAEDGKTATLNGKNFSARISAHRNGDLMDVEIAVFNPDCDKKLLLKRKVVIDAGSAPFEVNAYPIFVYSQKAREGSKKPYDLFALIIRRSIKDWGDLQAFIRSADKIKVYRDFDDKVLLYTSDKREDIEELANADEVVEPKEWWHCMCLGSHAIYLYKNGSAIGKITCHHGKSVRCSEFSSDAKLKDNSKLLDWYWKRGMTDPRKRFEADELRSKKK